MHKNAKRYKNKMFLRNENSSISLKDVEFTKKCLQSIGYLNRENLPEFLEES